MTDQRTSLTDLSKQLADAVAAAAPSVVSVHARPRLPSSGVHWRDGLVITTEATVKRDTDIGVTLPDGRRVGAKLVGRDPGTDLAALAIEPGLLPAAERGDSARLRPGHLALALARLGESGIRVSFGAVSAVGDRWRCWKGGEIDQWLQSDLALYPGFGGGPLVDAAGAVLGINSGGLSRPLATTIPGITIDRVVDHLVKRGFVPRGWLGAAMQAVRLDASLRSRIGLGQEGGLVVLSIEPDGPAGAAGLLIGDIIVALEGAPVEHPEQVIEFLGRDVVGRAIRVDLIRGGARQRVELTVGDRPRRPR